MTIRVSSLMSCRMLILSAFMCLGCFLRVFGQDPPMTSNVQDQQKYVDVLPPSPGVGSLSNFSRPGVGQSSGVAQFNVPLGEVSGKGFSVPLSIQYSSSGVRVDEIASRVGMGFQPNFGGAITRSIQGGADEYSTYLPYPETAAAGSRELLDYLRSLGDSGFRTRGGYDTEPDLFSFNFCGYSGKFILDMNDKTKAITFPRSNLQIKVNYTPNGRLSFRIIDPQGNVFFFGVAGVVERSKKDQSCSKEDYSEYFDTAYFLEKIVLNSGREILFSYSSPITYTYDIGLNQTHYYASPSNADQNVQAQPTCPIFSNNTCVNMVITQTRLLQSIVSDEHQAYFTYRSRSDCGDKLVSQLSISAPGATDTYTFEYDEVYTAQFTNTYATLQDAKNRYRPFLRRIIREGNAEVSDVVYYAFDYLNPSQLPVRLSFAQDHWGYFNGQNNSTLVPRPSSQYEAKFPEATANRESNPSTAALGMLTKITYPTGGYDQIAYGSNTVFVQDKPIYPSQEQTIYGTFTPTSNSTPTGSYESYTLPTSFVIGFQQPMKFSITLEYTGDGAPTHHVVGGYELYRVGSGGGTDMMSLSVDDETMPMSASTTSTWTLIERWTDGLPVSATTGYSSNTQRSIAVEPGEYRIKLIGTRRAIKVVCLARAIPGAITYQDTNDPVGGVRVERIDNFSQGTAVSSKYYKYESLDQPGASSAVIGYDPIYMRSLSQILYYSTGVAGEMTVTCNEKVCSYLSLFSSSINSLLAFSNGAITYRFVQEYNDPNQLTGLKQTEFFVVEDLYGSQLLGNDGIASGVPKTNSGIDWNGKPKQVISYGRQGNAFRKVKVQNYFYTVVSGASAFKPVYMISKKFVGCVRTSSGMPQLKEFDPYEVYRYGIQVAWLAPDYTEEISYLDDGVTEGLKTIVRYRYNNLYAMEPSEIETINSDGKAEVTKSFYTHDYLQVAGLNSDDQNVLSQMVNKDISGELISQERYVNQIYKGGFVARYLVNPANQGYYPKRVDQYYVPGIKAFGFNITSYDVYGNMLERRKDQNIPEAFLWDYSGMYLTAEVAGASQADIAATSFEADGSGNWVLGGSARVEVGKTGNKAYNMATGAITRSGLTPTTKYVVGFWTQVQASVLVNGIVPEERETVAGWTYREVLITQTATVTLTGSGVIDELRLYPEGARMTTFTHQPSRGVTSITDPNQQTSYFEYDFMGRLRLQRDAHRNILKTYTYHYKNAQ